MNRLTDRSKEIQLPCTDNGVFWARVYEKLARYEDSGLEPEEAEAAKEIVARLALADYPHNFQGERSDIASYMRWITSVLKDAKEWLKKLLEAREDAEKALGGWNWGYRSERR